MPNQPDRPTDLVPFTSDAEHFQYFFEGVLSALVARLATERDLLNSVRHPTPIADRILCKRKPSPVPEAESRHIEALALEAWVTAEYRERLDLHRRTPGAFVLGIDRTVEAYDLDEPERIVLLALTASCIGQEYAERILAGLELRCFAGGMTVENLISLLDPDSLAERIRFRAYFHRDSRLCQSGLIGITFSSDLRSPDEFLEGVVRLSPYGFGCLVGVPPEFMDAESPETGNRPDAKK